MATPAEQKKNPIQTIRVYIDNIPPARKRLILIAAAAFILIAAALYYFVFRSREGDDRVLYPGLDPVEAIEVHEAVRELGVTPTVDERGQILVPGTQYDYLLLQLAAQGHPRTTLSYDVFLNNTGMTSTESDKKQVMVFQLQNRIQDTLHRIEGVENAVVNLTIPDTEDSVWRRAVETEQPATAGVVLTLDRDTELYPEQVSAIKTLIAASVPKMEPQNVEVIDAATGLALDGIESDFGTVSGSRQAMQLEQTHQDIIEANARRILLSWYENEGIYAVARVELDLDRMMQERMELLPRLDADGLDAGGYTTHREVEGVVGGTDSVAGLVGEENNTDIPEYPLAGDVGGETDMHYWGAVDYDYGYLKTQIEKGNAYVKSATLSVVVDERNLTEARRAELIDAVSKATNILPESIALAAMNPTPEVIPPIEAEPEPVPSFWETIPLWAYIAAGAALLLIILIVLIFIFLRKRAARLAAEREEALRQEQEEMLNEIDRYKQELADAARASVNSKDDAITGEIRQFAKDNPEITANLLRNWLKEGEA